jgi:hypothetical protein
MRGRRAALPEAGVVLAQSVHLPLGSTNQDQEVPLLDGMHEADSQNQEDGWEIRQVSSPRPALPYWSTCMK